MATFIDSTSAIVGATTAVSVAKPAGLATGHTVFMTVFTRGSTSASVVPLDPDSVPWPIVAGATGTSGSTASHARALTYRHYVTNAAAEPADYTMTLSTSGNGCVICWAVSGLEDSDTAVQVALLAADTSGSDALIDSPATTAPANGALAFRLAAMNTSDGIASWSTTGLTEDEDVAPGSNRVSGALGHHTQDAGAVAAKTWTAALNSGTAYGAGIGITMIVGDTPVVASAGPDQTVAPGTEVTLDGTASTGTALSQTWTQLSGDFDVEPYLQTPTAETSKFIAPAPVTPGASMPLVFQFEYVGAGNTDTDTATITVTEAAGPGDGLPVSVL